MPALADGPKGWIFVFAPIAFMFGVMMYRYNKLDVYSGESTRHMMPSMAARLSPQMRAQLLAEAEAAEAAKQAALEAAEAAEAAAAEAGHEAGEVSEQLQQQGKQSLDEEQ